MQQDRDRRQNFSAQFRYEDRSNSSFTPGANIVQPARGPRYGEHSPERRDFHQREYRARRSPSPRQASPTRPTSSGQGLRYRSDSNPLTSRYPEPTFGRNYTRETFPARDEDRSYTRPTDYTTSSRYDRSPQRWPTSATQPTEDYDRRPGPGRRRDPDEPLNQRPTFTPVPERLVPVGQSPIPSNLSYVPRSMPTPSGFERPPTRESTYTARPTEIPFSDKYKDSPFGALAPTAHPYSSAPRTQRGPQLVSQFTTSTGSLSREGDRYSSNALGSGIPHRSPATATYPPIRDTNAGYVKPVSNRFAEPTPRAYTSPKSYNISQPVRDERPATSGNHVLSLRDSLPSKDSEKRKEHMQQMLEGWRERRLRGIEEAKAKDYTAKQWRSDKYTRELQLKRRLPPELPATLPVGKAEGPSRWGEPHKLNGQHSLQGKGAGDSEMISEIKEGVKITPKLKVDTSLGRKQEETHRNQKRTEEHDGFTTDSTTKSISIQEAVSDDTSSGESTPIEKKFSPPGSAWQGVSRSPRDALVRIIVGQADEQEHIIDGIKDRVQKANASLANSHGPKKPPMYLQNFDGDHSKIPSRDTRMMLVGRFRSQEDALEEKIRALQKQYRSLSKKWEEQCRTLDDQIPTEEPVSLPAIDPPLTGRVGRRTRGGPSDMVYSEFDLEQFAQKQVESDRVDAELLGRQNAAEVPDMIAVTKESFWDHKYQETNSLVKDMDGFYNYWRKDPWSEEEKDFFFETLADVGKRFGVIGSNPALRHRSVQDLVRFYYRNKADIKYMELANHSTKRKGKHRGAATAGLGGLLGDIRAGEEKKTDKVFIEEEIEEDSDSAYEQEGARRKPTKPRGRGRGRGRGGWRGRGGTARAASPMVDANGDIEMAEPQTAQGEGLPDGWPSRMLPDAANSRKRKARAEDGDEDGVVEKKKVISSYWHLQDRTMMKALIEEHGDDYDSIADKLRQKSGNQVKNYIRGHPELADVLDQVLMTRTLAISEI